MTNVTPLRREGPPLTKEQRALARSVPGLAERVAYDLATKLLGGDPRSPDRIQSAHLGIVKAAQTHDGDLGTFETWAYWKGFYEALDTERRERRQRRMLTAGLITGFRIVAARGQRGSVPRDASDDELMEMLVGRAEEQLVGNLLGVAAASEDPPERDDDLAERSEWEETTAVMLQELGGLRPEWTEVFVLFAHGHDVKAMAKARGVDYSNLLDQFHRQLKVLRARLEAKHIHGVPKRPADARPVLPEREPPAPRQAGAKRDEG